MYDRNLETPLTKKKTIEDVEIGDTIQFAPIPAVPSVLFTITVEDMNPITDQDPRDFMVLRYFEPISAKGLSVTSSIVVPTDLPVTFLL